MIDEDRTMQLFLYTSDELVSGSHKPVVIVCEGCGTPRVVQRRRHKEADLCVGCALIKRWDAPGARERQGAIVTKRYEDPLERAKTSIAIKKAYENPELREIQGARISRVWSDPDLRARQSVTQKKRWEDPILREQKSVESKKVWSDPELREKARDRGVKRYEDPAVRERASIASKKMWESTELREKASLRMTKRYEDPVEREKTSLCTTKRYEDPVEREKASAIQQGISYDEWEGFAKHQPYCPRFNEACRESNREKYDRRCFLSGTTEMENEQKLSVHHIDMNKDQGCDGHTWKLVPLCRKWHGRVHTSLWLARIQYLLAYVWNPGRTNVVS